MNPEKDAALCKAFPHVFRDRHAPMTQTAFCWGFEFNDGWYDIIYKAASKLEPLIVKMIDTAVKENDADTLDFIPTTSQIKEKFGTLRWYLTTGTDKMYKIIDAVEKKSETICEQCGKPGKLRGKSWYFTMCAKCWKKREVEYGKRTA